MMTATLNWTGGLQFVGESGTGHAIVVDGSPNFGGKDTAMRPMELLLVGIGGCSGMDIASILSKKRLKVSNIQVNVKGSMEEDYPHKFKDIELEFVVTGIGISEEAVKKAVDLSMEKYCSVKATLEGSAKISFTYKVLSG